MVSLSPPQPVIYSEDFACLIFPSLSFDMNSDLCPVFGYFLQSA